MVTEFWSPREGIYRPRCTLEAAEKSSKGQGPTKRRAILAKRLELGYFDGPFPSRSVGHLNTLLPVKLFWQRKLKRPGESHRGKPRILMLEHAAITRKKLPKTT